MTRQRLVGKLLRLLGRLLEEETSDTASGNVRTSGDIAPPRRTEMANDALEAAADGRWRSSAELADAAGWSYGGRWRGCIAELIREGLLERDRRTRRVRAAVS